MQRNYVLMNVEQQMNQQQLVKIEDSLLYQYWSRSKGNLFLEVPIGNKSLGNWPPKSKVRSIDGIIVIDVTQVDEFIIYCSKDYNMKEFFEYIQGKTVELIEVKSKLNRLVIGQVITGMDMFKRQY